MAEMSSDPRTTGTGPAKQFIAIVGDVSGAIKKQLAEKLHKVEGEDGCYSIETYYYTAKFGIKDFSTLADLTKDFNQNKPQMMCLFISYKSPDQLKQVKSVADKIKADMRVLVIESMKSSSEAEKVDELASKNEFETVYLKPNEEQRRDAEEHSEKVGVERLIETIEVCNWPWRICNAVAKGKIPTVMQENHTGDIEEKMGDGVNITDPVAELLMNNYQEWQKKQQVNASKIPAPQRAERVHLSDSPTTTEGTTNPDDASISVDIDLTKNQEENETRSREKNDEEEINSEKQTQSGSEK